jgi:hypothetical protein
VIVEGTCDEEGWRGGWVLLDESGPLSLTPACRVDAIDRPSDLAVRHGELTVAWSALQP